MAESKNTSSDWKTLARYEFGTGELTLRAVFWSFDSRSKVHPDLLISQGIRFEQDCCLYD
ncbi:hypothetical protein [Leptospira kirschneri]|uniref:hypothetical protein n=1 Tax=Leptospira kirschneri TaxID=29507 RepID=UPI0021C84A7C|nr:hypothetical protein [Leptospira kirschneri]